MRLGVGLMGQREKTGLRIRLHSLGYEVVEGHLDNSWLLGGLSLAYSPTQFAVVWKLC
jgi:hypothetical protein